ncbi:lipid-A-disaccharide synthase N-terminal domain-containing protein [Sunxiuqinia sp. A32]|uniref:lipid-A-disaccharide synthase N-terminal domain-containing protein n=1 Tax=Sunxiuqinia sp. A32 TaxID=3461496 RepID=UPI0040462017
MKDLLIFGIGFLAQILFFGRTIVQWFKSEHEGQVLSPSLFWKLSLVASILMLTYGIMRNDAAILIGQLLVYFIYVRNLQLKGAWKPMNILARIVILLMPAFILSYLFFGTEYTLANFFKNENNPFVLMVWGIAAQLVFISRFFYQWVYSENRKESILPLGFWIISICGSAMNFIYGIFRLDPVLLAAHSLGMFIYLRNILIHFNKKSIFDKIDVPVVNKLIAFISGKIK